ncbi:ABC transporter ATP-binding protein [Breoghania sp.]|uniref:ABC transporter ATP-binding protein n=1 Tax=Breoghania sp. TaxID=2065378 RepID=UPI002AA87BFE|nr:ABC transporter ATP-binding protein [Breoghania sp.]
MKGAHLAVEAVTHSYRRAGAPAVCDVTFQVEPGEALALVGRSGCGKSTLLHIMSGLILPTQGKVLIDGLHVTGPSPKWVVMFQQPSLYPWMSVAQNVALGLKFTGRKREIATRVPEMLRLVELSDYADRNVQDLSGGQQQRVALARSLAPAPEVLLLDEPFSALDAFTRGTLQRDVRRIAKELGITLVLVTHDLPEAVVMADRALVLSANPGRLADIVDIDLANRDDLRSPEYAEARARLAGAYERAAGRELGAAEAADDAGLSENQGLSAARPAVR